MHCRHVAMLAAAGAACLLVAGALAAPSVSTAARVSRIPPRPPAESFSARVDNPWFPLEPGTRYVYVGVKDGRRSRDVVTVTPRTRTIDGVRCRAVEDLLFVDGRLAERTTDWYSQDAGGNVWYFGERTSELGRNGRVTSTEGSWTSGADGAAAGLFMPAAPHVGQTGQQELYRGHAEDRFAVIGLFRGLVGARTKRALLIRETTPLEPGVVDHKLYVRGIGVVLEQTEKGGDERNELVSVRRVR
jgi:hypothetical protein